MVRNFARFFVTDGIGGILMFIGKALIIILSGWFTYLIVMNTKSIKNEIYSPVFPVIIVVIIAYILGSIFLSVYSFSATAILHAFLLDEEVGGKRAPGPLVEFAKKNQKQKKDDGESKTSLNKVEKEPNNMN